MFEGEPERDMYGRFEVPLKKVGGLIVPTDEEIQINNRARSAKLRIAEKIVKERISDILRGKALVNGDAWRNWVLIFFISFLAIVMIAFSHIADAVCIILQNLIMKLKR